MEHGELQPGQTGAGADGRVAGGLRRGLVHIRLKDNLVNNFNRTVDFSVNN